MPSDAEQARAMAKLVRLLGWTWLGLVSADNDFGRFGIQMLLEELKGTEVCVAYHEVIPQVMLTFSIYRYFVSTVLFSFFNSSSLLRNDF